MHTASTLASYIDLLKRALGKRGPGKFLLLLLASALHALGHAALALVASGLTVGLVQAWGSRGPESLGARTPYLSYADKALFLSGFGLAAVFVKGAAGVYATYVQRQVAAEVGNDLRLQLLDSLLASHHLRRPRHIDQGTPTSTAAGVSALTDRIRDVELGLKAGMLGGIRAGAQLFPLLVVLFALSQRMAALSVVVLGAFGVVLARSRAGFRQATANVTSERERLLEAADECVRHADLWVTFGAERKVRASVRRLGDALARGAATLEARAAALSAVNEVLAAAALVAALGAARAGWLGPAEQQGALLAFSVCFFMAYRPLRDLADARLAWMQGRDAYEGLRAGALRRKADADTTDTDSDSRWQLAALELCGLKLARGAEARLTLRIEPGSIVVVCGPTGAGKTTLLRTLLGLEPTLEGDILYGGETIEGAAAGPASRPFAWVPQDAPLLADTLAANVALGIPGAAGSAESTSREALRSVGAEHMAAALGTERLGSGARSVSGGERQWIALARAVATGQPVLLLDEPTSGMDAESQRRVLEGITRLRGHRTVILVTHRPEPLAIADAVVHLGAVEALGRAA